MFEPNEEFASRAASRLKTAAVLPVGAMIVVVGIAVGMNRIGSHRQAAPAATISIDDIQRHIDMKALPVQSVADFT